LAALAPEDKADPRVDEVYLSGERQRPADPEAVSLRLDGGVETVCKAIVDQPKAGDGSADRPRSRSRGSRPQLTKRPSDFTGGYAGYALDRENAERLWNLSMKLIS
jgi:hypothetical protein